MTAEFIVENIKNKEFAKRIFSAIFQSSQAMIGDLRIIKEEWVREFIVEQNQKLGYFKWFYLEPRLDRLIQYYMGQQMREREEKYIRLYKTQDSIIDLVVKENLRFYLTGGTALQRFYFDSYRYSDDLDFFLMDNGTSNANSKEFQKFIDIFILRECRIRIKSYRVSKHR